jgi:LuxR family transcriptional regulator, maltose regulon positive regulatory protein
MRSSREHVDAADAPAHAADPWTAVVESKLRPPPERPGIVPRTALVERLLTRDTEPLLALSAPAGYGKTTVLSQWSTQQARHVAWLSVDKSDNDPSVLLGEAAVALSRARLVDPAAVESVRSRSHSTAAALASLIPALVSTEPVAVVLDHLEAIDNPESLDVISELALRLPRGSRLAVSTRAQPPLPTPLLRSRGDVVEVGVDDLAMDRDEAHLLFTGAGVQFSDDEVDRLVERTEGWPAGLYLAALAAKVGRAPGAEFIFRGDDRLVGDYLRSEIFSQLDPSVGTFLTRTAILDHLCGPLCDAVLETRGSQAVLESLESSNLLLVPLDRHREWYRYHRLFRDLLLAELRRNESELMSELHARAAHWLETNRMPEAAIVHAQQAGEPDRVARLVATSAQPAYAAGRATTVRWWLDWFRSEGLIEQFPGVAVLGAQIEALRGQPASAERWAIAAESGTFEGNLPDGSRIEGWVGYMRALMSARGLQQMRVDAKSAQHGLAPGSPFRAGALLFEGLSYALEGDAETADPILARAVDIGRYLGATAAACVALAERGLLAMARQDWDDTKRLSAEALAIVAEHRVEEQLEAALVFVVAARVAVHEGAFDAARDHVAKAARLRPLFTYAIPFTALIQLELAKAYLELADPTGARTVLREMRDILHQRPDLGTLGPEADKLRSEVDSVRHGSIGASSLTVAELRLLPYLATHLSFREIGERLHVSRHTVKSQAISVYRKLGVSSRSEAIVKAQEIGLLAG